MCDVCTDLLVLLENFEERSQSGGFHLNKKEILAFVLYVCVWPQRQCMCCFKDYRNFEKLNSIVQDALIVGIRLIQTLPEDNEKEIKKENGEKETKKKEGENLDEKKSEEENKTEEDKDGKQLDEKNKEETNESEQKMDDEDDESTDSWTIEEKERLLQFVTKVFLMNFPSYMAYKHVVHSTLEELSTQETSALNNYCEISDPEVPLFLLRNVCFFCDTNGIAALKSCFEKATPETLPFNFAHLLITLIANLRLWMNIPTVMQYIIPLRTAVIRYMCKLSDKDLRMAGNRNMTDLMWAAVKEPLETHFNFDKDGLELAFKYFTCSTLTIRLAGIAQINNQITLYNESCNNESLMDAERVGHHLAQWLIDYKIIEHIFGPNLHVELIKQSQIILNFLAVEGRITNEHVDYIWAAAQLKHCGKQVFDTLIPLIKNLELQPVQHLLGLVSALDVSAHTESTLYLASALIKCIWNTCAVSQSQALAIQQQNLAALKQEEAMETEGEKLVHKKTNDSVDEEMAEHKEQKKPGTPVEGEGENEGVQTKHVHHGHKIHRHVEGHESEEAMDSESESVGLPHSDESGEEGEHCGCHFHGVRGHHHVHGHHIHRLHGHGHHELHDGSGGSDSDVETSESSEGGHEGLTEEQIKAKIAKMQHKAAHKHLHHKHVHHAESSEEMDSEEDDEEIDSELLDSEEEEEEMLKQQRHKRLMASHNLHSDNSEVDSDFDEEDEYHQAAFQARISAAAHQRAKQAMLANEERKRRFKKRVMGNSASVRNLESMEEGKGGQEEEGAQAGSGQDSDTGVVMAAASLLQENEGNPPKKLSDGTEVFDHSDIVRQLQKKQRLGGFNSDSIMSPDRGSCHSSRISNKSEKNMADFDGEDLASDDELSRINAHANFTHLSSMASMYHTHMPHLMSQRPNQKEAMTSTGSEFCYEDVCKPGNTLLWDLVQEDKVNQLPEGLAMDAEKALCSLICFSTDRRIKMKFIEACVNNLAHHRSVVVSLSILPKIFSSFQQYRSGTDTHTITMWAEEELNMMTHFFIDLIHYTELHKADETTSSLYGHKEEVQVRLLFLTCVFSSAGSPDRFRLNLEQVDTLWSCLALDKECSDDCLSWFLNQAKSKDHHAMGLETFKHIFLEKMAQLNPESMSMIGLNLFQQLSHLSRIANASCENPLLEDQVSVMDQLWNIALRALNTDVSITAIQFLNSYYINYGNCLLEKEEEFVKRCMQSLTEATSDIYQSPETNLLVIQRGLILLKNHLEAFRKRYAYHLRNWQIDGKGIVSHQRSLSDKQSSLIRVQLQPAGIGEKTPIEMSSTDLIGELRAEVNRWWESMQKQHLLRQQGEGSSSSVLTPILGAMLGDGPMRMITLGQELSSDMDEKTLGEMQFKDLQLVLVSVGNSRPARKIDGSIPSASLPSPPVDRIPMMLLNQEPFFGQLLTMLEKLSKLDLFVLNIESQERWGLQTKARVLSRKVWELLMLLPTNPAMLQGFKSITSGQDDDSAIPDWKKLLNTHSPQRLMYSLQIVEGLSRGPKHRRRSMARSGGGDSYQTSTESEMSGDGAVAPEDLWSKRFIMKKGLSHMFNIFKSGSLQMKEDEAWSQWDQECLAFLLRLITQFSIDQSDVEAGHDDVFETQESPRKKLKKQKYDKIIIPRLDQSIVAMLPVSSVLEILMKILYDAAVPSDTNQMHAGSWGRSEVVHYSLSFLVSWAFSSDEVRESLCTAPNFDSWLKRLTLEAPEPHVRREACVGLYRLCLGKTAEGKTGYPFLLPILSSMLSFMSDALKIKPQKNLDVEGSPKEKEPYGPGVKDYFWLVCRFVESISKTDASPEACTPVNLNNLAKDVCQHVLNREYYETRHGFEEDDALIGLLNLGTAVFKHNPPYKSTVEIHVFINELFECLFSLPSPVKRYLPKCKSQSSRSGAYDLQIELVKGNMENYKVLHAKMLHQHSKDAHASYPWDYWPHEDGRSKCGYVGLTNLGATCYMATCMQHLYMIPQARQSVLQAKCCKQTKHEGTLMELQKMFAYLQESERKAYNPRDFCKVYTMDKQPLNTGEQKDMTEFFTDLITKLEEMSPEMKKLVRSLFGGVITNNVVSLDCPHVSRTLEEFYTVRCQVTDMKNLYESLDEVTVKDMLEGDNMYTCSKCQKKVRAEKRPLKVIDQHTAHISSVLVNKDELGRACFKKLPKIICFNTMRYTFNMVTMMKEKVNTHFSFPLRLDMSNYMEKNLISSDKLQQDDEDSGFVEKDPVTQEDECYEYELIGVTVHTGTADGGHYYSFIRDKMSKSESGQDKWFFFNDAEVKQFDPSQIATECFGGEMTSKTYDSVTEKFMDFSFEKTNSAYMLFYERCPLKTKEQMEKEEEIQEKEPNKKFNFELSKELEQWIWQDNMQFLQDKNIIEHTYFDFMWQMCAYIPTTLPKNNPLAVSLMASQLSTSFVLETFIHAKEKPTMVQWIELLTKQFISCQGACEWFLDHMAKSDWWPQQILIKCPNQMIRQMFQRLLIHVITQLKPAHAELYLQPFIENEEGDIDVQELGNKSCVTRFIKKMLSILEHGVRPHSKYLMEYFAFLHEFAKMGNQECFFLLHINAISTMVSFYMGQKAQENYVEILSDDEEEEEVITMTEDAYKPLSLEKMISLISLLVENSRGEDNQLQISGKDYNSIVGGKGFLFLFNQIRDNINVRQTCNLVFSLCRWNEALANAIIQMVFSAVKKLNPEQAQPFFKFMSMLVEFVGGPPGMPPFTQYILQRYWDLTVCSPTMCLDWMANQVTRNKLANHWVLSQMDSWVENYLIKNSNVRVRNSAGVLLVSLVPSPHFRQAYRTSRSVFSPHKEIAMSNDALLTLHQIYQHLLSLLPRCRLYVDPQTHGTAKLMVYFAVLQYCLISKNEKLMFGHYFNDLWQLFQPKLSEPQIAMHHNKQSLLLFWYQACLDCPENVKLIVNNPNVCKHIPFTYILADHEDQDVMLFNRMTLPAYYGLLRMCCQQSRAFTRQLGQHQNILWAFKNISPYPAQYPGAVEELFRMMRLMATKYQDSSEEDLKAINQFKHKTILLYLQNLDARSGWQTLICALKILVDSPEDRLLLIYNQGLQMLTEAFYTLHVMYHEATACHVTGDIVDLLSILVQALKVGRTYIDQKKGPQSNEVKTCIHSWKEKMDVVKKLLTLLNSYTPPEIRSMSIDVLKEMILIYQSDCINVMVPILTQAHISFQDTSLPLAVGPYFPRRGQKPLGSKSNIRPPRPQFNMLLHSNQIAASKGVDDQYDMALSEFFIPYHSMVDLMCRVAVNQQILSESIINLSAMVAFEGVPLHSPYFSKLWYEIYHSDLDKSLIRMLCKSRYFMEYVDAVLVDERMSLNTQNIYQFFCNFFPKVYQQVLNEGRPLIDSLVASITAEKSALENIKTERELMTILNRINGDIRAMLLIFSVQQPKQWNKLLYDSLQYILQVCREHQQQRAEQIAGASKGKQRRRLSSQCSQEEEGGEDGGETPSKRRRLSSENQQSDSEANTDKASNSTASETEGAEKKTETTDSKNSGAEKSMKTSPSKTSGKTTKKAVKDSEPDIKEMVGSPRPVRNESPKPGTSKENIQRQCSNDETENQPPRRPTRQQSSGDETSSRVNVREKPSMVDLVAKHIENLFSLMTKDGDN